MIGRRYRLWPWLVRALIPEGLPGTYVLWEVSNPFYVGRSDTSLQRRLLEHALNWPVAYFTFDIAQTPGLAFDMECSLFHALGEQTINRRHPHRSTIRSTCSFCTTTLQNVREDRLFAPNATTH